ncbi:MAG TPA: CARDB domain-containing protein [Gaiellaceae bacterium]|nr:CARDB domain-containing protein [Gaiellaceae bacterium]
MRLLATTVLAACAAAALLAASAAPNAGARPVALKPTAALKRDLAHAWALRHRAKLRTVQGPRGLTAAARLGAATYAVATFAVAHGHPRAELFVRARPKARWRDRGPACGRLPKRLHALLAPAAACPAGTGSGAPAASSPPAQDAGSGAASGGGGSSSSGSGAAGSGGATGGGSGGAGGSSGGDPGGGGATGGSSGGSGSTASGPAKPNLTVRSIDLDGACKRVTVQIANTGDADADASTTWIVAVQHGAEVGTRRAPTPAIAAGATASVGAALLRSNGCADLAVAVTVDVDGAVAESNERDNHATKG